MELDTILRFENITTYSLREYLADFLSFNDNSLSKIISYYSGELLEVPTPSFDELKSLMKEAKRLNDIIILNKTRFETTDYWELLEEIENIKTKLDTINNSSKWLRSTITKGNFNPNVEVDYIMKQNQGLEKVAKNVIGSDDKENDWYEIAMRNDLKEEDYTSEGGNQIKIYFKNRNTIFIRSVVDNITGEKVYGLDLQKKIEFSDNDLTVLSYQETIKQAVEILANLRRRDIPEFEEDGIQSSLVVGSNRAVLMFPSIIRQLIATFSKDDTLRSLKITKIERREDNMFLEYNIETRLDEVIEQTTII